MAQSDNRGCNGRQLLAKFSGHKTVIRADLWCNLFEVVTREQTDVDRIFNLMGYLIDDALNWFAADIAPNMATSTWPQVRAALIARFGPAVTNPLVEAQRRSLKSSETVETYYEDKIRLLRQANLTEDNIVAQLSEGMPFSYRGFLLCAKPTTSVMWLTVALQLEATLKRQPQEQQRHKFWRQNQEKTMATALVTDTTPQNKQRMRSRGKDRPSSACRYCLEAGQTVFHWHRECQRRRNRIQNTGNSNSMAENQTALYTDRQSAEVLAELPAVQENFLGGRR
jgi:hypothetical protein